MTHPDKKSPDEMFIDSFMAELLAMPDDHLLEEGESEKLKALGNSLLDAAKKETGRRRLRRAQDALTKRADLPTRELPVVAPEEARAYIQRARNDSDYTLAARELNEMSDEDVVLLYRQMRSLDGSEEADGQ